MNQEVLYQLFEQATTAIVIFQEQDICYLNSQALALLNTERHHMYGRSLQALFPAHRNHELFVRLQHEKRSFSYQNATIQVQDAFPLTADLSIHKLTSSNNHVPAFQLNIYPRDMESTAHKEGSLSSANALLEVLRQQTTMPLSALENLLHRLLEKKPRQDQLPLIHSMLHSGEALKSTVQDILLYAELLYDKYRLQHEEFSPLKVVNELESVFRPKAEAQNKQLAVVRNSISQHDIFVGDPLAFRHIIYHLLDSAVRFTRHGMVQVELNTDTIDHNKVLLQVSVDVEDDGSGIPNEASEQATASYASGQSLNKQNDFHSGLGLSIMKMLSAKCGGNFSLQTTSAKTLTKISLPYRQAIVPKTRQVLKAQSKNPLQGLRLLYVEDLLPNHFLMEGLCAIWDISLDTAFNGQEAIGKFYGNPYDIILMDLNMPLMNGYDTSREMRNTTNHQKRSVPIIAVTGSISSEARRSIRDHGIDDILTKPIKPDELYQKLTTYAKI
jgi:CheY-like chemotaxis protein